MPPGNRLAPVSQNAFSAPPTLAEIQLAARTAQRPSPLTLGEQAQEINYGLGRGFTNILQGNLDLAQALYQDPKAVGKQMLEGYGQLLAHPVDTVNNSLREMWTRAKSSPAGLGEVVGENINPLNWLKPRKALRQELDVYHGTPHTFDPEENAPLGRFRSQKIGTGEGAQAYGYGLYFAENPDVAGEYRQIAGHQGPFNAFLVPDAALPELNELSYRAARSGNDIASNVYSELATGDFGPEQLLRKASKEELPAVREALANAQKLFAKHQGALYKVDLPDAKIEQMLDWDKPLSQQSASVRAAINGIIEAEELNRGRGSARFNRHTTGGDVMEIFKEAFGSPKTASNYLRQAGIPGVKFLDQGSRGVGQGTRNFVVFPGEEQSLNILSRD